MSTEAQTGLQYVQSIIDGETEVPFHSTLNIAFTTAKAGYLEMIMNLDPTIHGNSLGRAHGGAVFSLLDAAAGFAAKTTMEKGKTCVTVDFKASFNHSVKNLNGQLHATGEVKHDDSKKILSHAEVHDENNVLIATADVIMLRKDHT